jgi:hypothetical protein
VQASYSPEASKEPSPERKPIAEQAKALLKGEEAWKSTSTMWEDVGDAREVETDVTLPKE